jgi:hypothetical protein
VIHVYAFAEGLRALPDAPGLEGASLEQLSLDGVAAVFSRRIGTPGPDTLRQEAVTHGTVVDALVDSAAAVLPVRFGEVATDRAALAQSLCEQLPSIRGRFEHVRGCVEIGLRVWGDSVPAASEASGAAYMRARQAAERERRSTADALHERLRALARDARRTAGALHVRERLTAAYLVPRDRLDEIRSVVDGFAAAHPELSVVCTGPWAPYTFAAGAP